MKVEVTAAGITAEPDENDDFDEKRIWKFTKPSLKKEVKPLFCVGAVSPDGVLVKLPLEGQINNQVSSPDDLVGIRDAERRGFAILWDFANNKGVFCPAWSCYSKWDDDNDGFCSGPCKDATRRTDASAAAGRGFGHNATTSTNSVRLGA